MKISRFTIFSSIQQFETNSLLNLKDEFIIMHDFELPGYRRIWTNYLKFMIVTYCEGDIIIQEFDTRQEFKEELKKQAAFYENY